MIAWFLTRPDGAGNQHKSISEQPAAWSSPSHQKRLSALALCQCASLRACALRCWLALRSLTCTARLQTREARSGWLRATDASSTRLLSLPFLPLSLFHCPLRHHCHHSFVCFSYRSSPRSRRHSFQRSVFCTVGFTRSLNSVCYTRPRSGGFMKHSHIPQPS